jgi:tetratricopeptide (TPR) repeat protein
VQAKNIIQTLLFILLAQTVALGQAVEGDSARAFLNRGMRKADAGDHVEAAIWFTRALQSDSSLAVAYLYRGHAKNKLHDFKGAINDYNRAIRTKKLNWEESYEAYFNRGVALASLENMQAALANFNHVIMINPNHADAYYNRSILKGMNGDYEGELADINHVIALRPNDPKAYNSRGIAKSMLGQYHEALIDYAMAIELDRENADAYFNRGLVHYDMKEYRAALEDFSKAIQLRPDGESFDRRGNVKFKLGDFKGAFEDYTEAIALQPKNYVAYTNRGRLKTELKDFNSAIDDFNEALKLRPDYAIAYFDRALARKLNKEQEVDRAAVIRDFSLAIKYNPDYEQAWYERGMMKAEIGQLWEGCQDLNQAVNFPRHEPIFQLPPGLGHISHCLHLQWALICADHSGRRPAGPLLHAESARHELLADEGFPRRLPR